LQVDAVHDGNWRNVRSYAIEHDWVVERNPDSTP
jgi:hypothetical protein